MQDGVEGEQIAVDAEPRDHSLRGVGEISGHVAARESLAGLGNLFVSADGAGYIVDAKSRTLVERTGTAVVGTLREYLLTLFVVIHNGVAFEAFGTDGRLWKTAELSDRPLRHVVLTDDEIVGEAWKWIANRWMPFTVKIATGQVNLGLGL